MEMLDRYVTAFEQYDIDALTKVLREDATVSMPPIPSLVPGAGRDSELDAWFGLWLPWIATGAGCCVRLAGVLPVSGESRRRVLQSLGAYSS